ncbi:hypothetical protein [Nocardia sp. NPDC059228]|uniref:hypothetical protein n=1 Tax=Nocardia sp. NPDC059228 TaxID=3346777 RepID=UPI0036C405BE
MNLFGDLPGFAGGPIVPPPGTPVAVPTPGPDAAPTETEEFEVTGDIRDHSWDELPTAQPGHRTTLWDDPEHAAALQGPLAATDPVLGADTTTEAGTARIDTHTTYHEIEKHSAAEYSVTLTIQIKAQP